MSESYLEHVKSLERSLGPFAFRSERIAQLTDGSDAFRTFQSEWSDPSGGSARLQGRTPFMRERDRILYSDELRRQADKHHLLFYRNQRVRRDYVTHTLRMAQVARAICGRLNLNTDLAEAIAFGSKVGGVPFLHISKLTVDAWVRDQIHAIDEAQTRQQGTVISGPEQQVLLEVADDGRSLTVPTWFHQIEADAVRSDVRRFMPWAAGNANEPTYSSGQQSYWLLSTDPFLLMPRQRSYAPQTMYGVWRHSLFSTDAPDFQHKIQLSGQGRAATLTLTDAHLTHEAVVVRYADDVTWVIENLNEANRAAVLGGHRNAVFDDLAVYLQPELPGSLGSALQPVADTGQLYTYFIDDLVRASEARMKDASSSFISETDPLIVLGEVAARMLRLMKGYLEARVFSDDRIKLRNGTLGTISRTILDLLFESKAQALLEFLENRSRLQGWRVESLKQAETLTANAVHRVQACVDAFSLMSDHEVYAFIGLETL